MTKIKRLIFRGLLIVLLSQGHLLAQSTYSTYSILGVGDYSDPAVPAHSLAYSAPPGRDLIR